MNNNKITLASGRSIGDNSPCFIIAEIGNNHQGELALAKEMITSAAESGVDAVKLQKRDVDALFTQEGKEAPYSGPNSFGSTYAEHRMALELSIDELAELKELAEKLGIVFFASAWDHVSLSQLIDLNPELLKICSADLVNIPMLRQAGKTDIPIIISSGMSTLDQVDTAVAELKKFHDNIILLHCNSSYPCPDDQICLPVMHLLKERYGLITGYSGHEQGLGPSIAAAALGASVIERHITLDRQMRGTDHKASLEPHELSAMVKMIRETEQALTVSEKRVFSGELNSSKKLRKSIAAIVDIKAGQVITHEMITVKCPGTGVSPLMWDSILGMKALKDIPADSLIHDEDVE